MMESLDQKRARFAWEKVPRSDSEYTNLAKGAPALIMQSGLMPVLAFYNEKRKQPHHGALLEHICLWLQERFPTQIPRSTFEEVMKALMGNSQSNAAEHAQFYRMATEEALSILRWIRQFAAATGR